jgi:hypothetical protein
MHVQCWENSDCAQLEYAFGMSVSLKIYVCMYSAGKIVTVLSSRVPLVRVNLCSLIYVCMCSVKGKV